jgi:Flp pilus assembly protein TadD
MTRFVRSACVLAALTLLLAGCAQTPVNEMGASATAAAAAPADAPPMERHEASAQCWMKYDKSGGSLEAKAKLVDKCITEKTKPGAKP